MSIRVGTAAWALPRTVRDRFPAEAESNLHRYAARFSATEINTSFYRPHKRATYERWAASVPNEFRFAVKLPKAITHERRLTDCDELLARFAGEIDGLGAKRGPVLIQLPPKLIFDAATVTAFLKRFEAIVAGLAAFEPRHPSWFDGEADALLAGRQVARVAADPAPVPDADIPGGWAGLAYFRLHGSPRIYWSGYEADALAVWHGRAASAGGGESWMIFDNTASGRATADALAFAELG